MISKEQYLSEKEKENEFNKLFDAVAQKSPFGQWYGYMCKASDLLTSNLPKVIAVSKKDGRPFVLYRGDFAKLAGVWGTATHKVISNDLAHKKYGRALADLLGFGQIAETYKQTRKKDYVVFNISPDDVSKLWAEKTIKEKPELKPQIEQAFKSKEMELQNLWNSNN